MFFDEKLYGAYLDVLQPIDLNEAWRAFLKRDDLPPLEIAISGASIYSSQIEGEEIDEESFAKRESEKTIGAIRAQDLIEAYRFAQTAPLNRDNVFAAHRLLSRHLVPEWEQGALRKKKLVIRSERKIVYYAPDPERLVNETAKFFGALEKLQRESAFKTPARVFFEASLSHLTLVNLHPFADGNGRLSRLLEKWHLATHLGAKAWLLPTERCYLGNLNRYFANLRRLGEDYDSLDYALSLPFLAMSAKCLLEFLNA